MLIKKHNILTREEISIIEKKTEEIYGINRLILMENAGRTLAEVIKHTVKKYRYNKICIVAGKGNNGGDGFVTARYLFNMGMNVKVIYIAHPEEFSDLSFTNYQILCRMGIGNYPSNGVINITETLKETDVIVDAVFGTGIKGNIAEIPAEVISLINESRKFVVSADIPSGLDANTGIVYGKCVKSNITVSFGFAKKGFYINSGPEHCGEIVIMDIGFPLFFYKGDDEK